jgi:hypothetical protein
MRDQSGLSGMWEAGGKKYHIFNFSGQSVSKTRDKREMLPLKPKPF